MFSLAAIVERAATLFAERPAVIQGPVALSYAELCSRAMRIAGALRALGLQPGDRVALLGRNSFRYLELNLACAWAGLVLVPLNIRLAASEIRRILELTEARLLFASIDGPTTIPIITWEDAQPPGAPNAYERLTASGPMLDTPSAREPSAVAQIFFTSGTTGEPKGACLTHQNLIATALDSIVTLDLCLEDVWFHAAPMFHLVDASVTWGLVMVGGRHLTDYFDPARFCEDVQTHRVTKVALPPTLLDMIVRGLDVAAYDLRSLDRIAYGGAPMPEPVYRRCTAAFGCPLVQSYGTTETSGGVFQQFPRDVRGKSWRNSVGQPDPLVQVRIVDDAGSALPVGEIGEIIVGGPKIMAGYWRNKPATDAAVRDGWYHTGDLGVCDAHGHYAIVGRKKDMIITGGENVYPTEVENALLEHPAVAEAAVFGVPSPQWGEEVRAVVFLNAEAIVTQAELIEHCRSRIGGFKIPKVIEFAREALPRSGPGKIAKAVLRASYRPKAS
jgi:long-chain acyl-CoA synthetase